MKEIVRKFIKFYRRSKLRKEYEAQEFAPNERVTEYCFILRMLQALRPKSILDVGTGETAFPQLLRNCGFIVSAIDNCGEYWPTGLFNWHFYLIYDDICSPRIEKKFDFISCVSTLEHIPKHNDAVKGMFSLLNPGGYLALTVPYNENEFLENVYLHPEAGFGKHVSYICHVFSRNELNHWLNENKARIVQQEYWQTYSGKFHTFGQKIYPERRVGKEETHQLTCVLIQKFAEDKDRG